MIQRSSIRFRELVAVAATALLVFTAAAPASAAPSGGTIEGTVAGDGAGPLAGVEVIAIGEGGYEDSRATTDAAGAYRLDLEPGTYRLAFTPVDGSPWAAEVYEDAPTLDEATELAVTAGSSTTADAVLVEGSTISGRVTCGGEAIGGIQVGALQRANPWVGRGAMTAEDGTYRITGVVPGDYEVSFQGSGDCIGELWDDVEVGEFPTLLTVSDGEDRSGIDADLVLGGSITGTISSANGRTYGQVLVFEPTADGAGTLIASFPASSGDGGGYTVSAIPAGDYLVEYDASEGSRDQWYPDATTSAGATPVRVESGVATTGIDFEAVAGATISGTVGGHYTENPGFVDVTATPVGALFGDGSQVATVAPDGSYSIPFLTPGEYIVSVPSLRDENYTALTEPQWYRNSDTVEGAVPVTATGVETTGGIDFTLRAVGSIAPTPAPTLPPRLAALLERLGLDAGDARLAAACASTTDESLQRRLDRLGVEVSTSQLGQVRMVLCA